MSANSMLSNNGISQPVLSPQQQVSSNRTRAVSSCSTSGIPLAQYQQNYSQSYQTFPPIHASWTQTQQGMYMNVYPGTNISEVDDMNLNQPGENFKYQHGVKLPGVASQLAGQSYHPSGGLSGNAHGALQQMNAQVPFAVAAAPNGLTQAPTSVPTAVTSLRSDPSNILHSSTSHPTTPGQSLFVHGFVGQQNVTNQLGQSTLSPSFVAESQAVGPSIQLGSYNTKHNAQLNGSHNPRALPHTPLSGAPTPATHPSYAAALPLHQAPTASHPSFYTNSSIQQPPGHLAPSGLPHGMVEFLPAMISTDPNTAQSQFNAASFGQYATHYPSTYDPAVDTAYNQRVRHNTWAGLETNAPGSVQAPNRTIDPQPYENTFDLGISTNSNNNNSSNNRVSLASDRVTSLPQRGTSDTHGHLNSTAYNINSTAPVGSQLPELLEFYSSLPVADHWLSVCNRYSNSTLPLTGTARATKTDERGFDSRISHWNPMPPPPLANQWSAKHANSMMSSGYKSNTSVHAQNSSTMSDNLGPRRMMDGSSRPQNSTFFRRGQDVSTNKTALNSRAPMDASGANRIKTTRSNPTTQYGKSVPNQKRIGSWRPATTGTGLDGGKPIGHFNPTADVPAPTSNLMAPGVECNWIMPSPLNDPTVMRNAAAVQSNGIRGHDPLNPWSGQLTNPLLLTMNPGQMEPAGRPTKLMPQNPPLPFVDANGMLYSRLPDPSSGLARFNHGLRLLRDVFPTRILVSTALVGAVIGRGGRTIRLITAKTGAQIDFKPETVLFSQFSLPSGVTGNPRAPVSRTSHSSPQTSKNLKDETAEKEPKEHQSGVDTTTSPDRATSPQKPKTPPTTTTQPLQQRSSPATDSTDHPRTAQLSRSQPVYLFGTREQCSAAVGEILSVCFRECVHGPSAPCLGLLVSHQVYQQLLMGWGRRYFGLLHAATGARVSVTGSPVHLEPLGGRQSGQEKDTKKTNTKQVNNSPDRIIVVRGELAAICAAEAYISEQVRLIMARDSVPVCLWPLLPHLPPLVSSPQSHSASLAAASAASANSVGPSFDLATLNRLALCVALMFWNPSTWNKLISYVPFGSAALRSGNATTASRPSLAIPEQRRAKSMDRVEGAAGRKVDPHIESPGTSDATESTVDHASLPPPDTQSVVEAVEDTCVEVDIVSAEHQDEEKLEPADHEVTADDSHQEPNSSVICVSTTESCIVKALDKQDTAHTDLKETNGLSDLSLPTTRHSDSAPVSPIARTPVSSPVPQAAPATHSALLSFDVASLTFPGGKPFKDAKAALFHQTARDRELLASLQQAIVTAVGPAACLSTSGLLYMRVSYHEAGALIGTRGCRIRQIMESTGAKIHVGKTRISEPYALTMAYRGQRMKPSSKPKFEPSMESTLSGDINDAEVEATGNQISRDTEETVASPVENVNETATKVNDHGAISAADSQVDQSADTHEDVIDSKSNSEHISKLTNSEKQPEVEIAGSTLHVRDEPEIEGDAKNATSPVRNSPTGSLSAVAQDEGVNGNDLSGVSGKSSMQSGYRLVTLSGPLQAQLMAHWRVFQCLKSLRPREDKHDKSSPDGAPETANTEDNSRLKNNTKSESSNLQPQVPEPLRLATLVCIPYAFWSWLTVPNTTFEHPDMPDDRRRANASALSWLQAEARRRMQGRYADYAQVKAICLLRKPKHRIMARLRRGPTSGSAHGSAVGSTLVSPVDDIVTALWSDRSRAPIEIYADYETTQFLLGCLHHMHAVWLYGETVVQRTTAMSNQSALLSTPPSRRQQPLIYPTTRTGASHLASGMRQTLPSGGDLNGFAAGTAATSRGSLLDWSPLWYPYLPTDLYGRMVGNPNGAISLPHPDGYGRYSRVRGPVHASSRWQTPGRPDRSRFNTDSAGLLAAMMMMSANTTRPSSLTSSFNPTAFGQFPLASGSGLVPNGSKAGQSQTVGHSSALLFNPFPLTPSLPDLPGKPFSNGLRWDDRGRIDRNAPRKHGGSFRSNAPSQPSNRSHARESQPELSAPLPMEESSSTANSNPTTVVDVADSSEQQTPLGDAVNQN